MAISNEQRKALEALGYKIGKSGRTVQNSDGATVGGFNENGNVFSGNKRVAEILKSKPTAEAAPKPKPKPKPKASTSAAPAPKPAPKPAPAVGGAKAEQRRAGSPPVKESKPKKVPGRALWMAITRGGNPKNYMDSGYARGGRVSSGKGKTY